MGAAAVMAVVGLVQAVLSLAGSIVAGGVAMGAAAVMAVVGLVQAVLSLAGSIVAGGVVLGAAAVMMVVGLDQAVLSLGGGIVAGEELGKGTGLMLLSSDACCSLSECDLWAREAHWLR
jgi:hypothetical protein